MIASLIAGCGGDAGTAASGTPTRTPAQTGAPAPTGTSAPSPVAEKAADTAGSKECKVRDLALSLEGHGFAAGTAYSAVIFTNKGRRTCTMQGFPGVSYVAGEDGHQVGAAAYRTGDKGPVITLAPGGIASAMVGFSNVHAYDVAYCDPTEVRGLRIYPPHDYDSLFLPMAGTGCANNPPDNQLSVATVQAGAGGH